MLKIVAMKSANPSDVTSIETSLSLRPLDTEAILDILTPENYRYTTAIILSSYDRLAASQEQTNKILQEHQKLLLELTQNSKDTRITETKLAKFFVALPHLLDKFSYDIETKQLFFKDEPIRDGDDSINFLSIDLQNYFAGHIPYSVLLTAMKRYFAILRRQDNVLVDFVEEFLKDYFSTYTTKKRTRVYLKEIKKACKDHPDADQKTLKAIMVNLGYTEEKDTSRVIFYTKP